MTRRLTDAEIKLEARVQALEWALADARGKLYVVLDLMKDRLPSFLLRDDLLQAAEAMTVPQADPVQSDHLAGSVQDAIAALQSKQAGLLGLGNR